jgi:prolyl-tRNA editing enzyme YbaK/EbsC (Cys-tRNA(Pro) deacylase)
MKDALDVHRFLLAAEVPHEVVRLPRPLLSADEIPDVLGLPNTRCVAVRIYQADDRLAAVLVRAGEHPHPGAVLTALDAKSLRVAPPDLVNAATDFAAALVSPVTLPAEIDVLADSCLGHADVVYAATGDAGTALGIPTRWLLTVSRARVAELCAPAASTVDLSDELDAEVSRLVGDRRRG